MQSRLPTTRTSMSGACAKCKRALAKTAKPVTPATPTSTYAHKSAQPQSKPPRVPNARRAYSKSDPAEAERTAKVRILSATASNSSVPRA